ncbi:hypothetical protein ASF49_15940 [Methylobacterium sp. Leaf104]|uniref:hypothetical protein n=1 Tax=Methylobacterium TaxID=407 RepID=UPI0006FBCBEC|nr:MULTISPECIES: hypothetical protein [Methylobacterium]KQO42395.1 hypothetical protein ASF08_12340 [Methylobacterium sp. Leaf85]KQP29649.1 hypothetical protein ASF49_15940 [Methylobacterium sp. Leaf104]KQQ24153.1 hypothetical protein ASF58_16355 [Methylobacterium sp. Leaf125]MCI9881803.1 hypothetical protein [Methylobacterium goesingense]
MTRRITPETLAEVGTFLLGPEWRRPLAALLGPLHPEGARPSLDPRLPARWATGEREIPVWVGDALIQILDEQSETARALANRLKGE